MRRSNSWENRSLERPTPSLVRREMRSPVDGQFAISQKTASAVIDLDFGHGNHGIERSCDREGPPLARPPYRPAECREIRPWGSIFRGLIRVRVESMALHVQRRPLAPANECRNLRQPIYRRGTSRMENHRRRPPRVAIRWPSGRNFSVPKQARGFRAAASAEIQRFETVSAGQVFGVSDQYSASMRTTPCDNMTRVIFWHRFATDHPRYDSFVRGLSKLVAVGTGPSNCNRSRPRGPSSFTGSSSTHPGFGPWCEHERIPPFLSTPVPIVR
jgi:hypothetical protein